MTGDSHQAMQRLFAGQLSGWPLADVVAWLLTEGRRVEATSELVAELCARFVAAGAPLIRVRITVSTLHPQVRDFSFTWLPGRPVETERIHHGVENSTGYVGSPWAHVFETGKAFRRRLHRLDEWHDHGALHEVKALGGTDYLALPLRSGARTVGAAGFVVGNSDGLSEDDLAKLEILAEVLTPILQVTALHGIARTLLDTYVGHRTGERVLKGQIKRGDAEAIEAAICFSDLRDFTRLSESRPLDEVIGALNSYFEFFVAATTAHGGEVLKFIGDAVLAIFPTSRQVSIAAACNSALDAAEDAFANLATVNIRRRRDGLAPLSFGIGLHQGTVIYGNVGAPERLDFTVMGAAVNRTARLETLTKTLGQPLLMSQEFVACVSRPVRSLGRHEMAGIAEPQEAFALAEP